MKRGRESSGTKVKREREREWDDHKEAEEASGRGRVLLSLGRCVSQRVDCRPSKRSEHAREDDGEDKSKEKEEEGESDNSFCKSRQDGRRGERCKVKSKTRAWGTIAAPH